MGELDAVGLQRVADPVAGEALGPEFADSLDRSLLLGDLDQRAAVRGEAPAEGHAAAEIVAAAPLVARYLDDSLARAVALGLGDGGQDGEDQLADAVAGRVTAEVDHVQADAGCLHLGKDVEGIEGGTEHPVQLWRDDDIARLGGGEERRSLWPVAEGLGAGDAALDEGVLDGHAVHLGIAGDGALLHVEAFALIGLHGGADAGVAEHA